MNRPVLWCLALLTACGSIPTGPEAQRLPRCVEWMRWQQVYMTDSLNVPRVDSIRVVGGWICS